MSRKWLFGLLILLAACKKDSPQEVDMGYAYYPAEVGSWITYQVDSVRHFASENTDTVRYQIRELLESAFTDDAGRPARRIERFYRNTDQESWSLKDVWMVVVTNRKVEKVEENVRFIRMTFPVKIGQYWDGNAKNTLDSWDYTYSEVGAAETVGDTYFENTAVVEQEGAVNLIEQERGKEIYAHEIGLVYKELIEIKTDVNYMSNPTPENIQSGYEVYYTYLSHGQN